MEIVSLPEGWEHYQYWAATDLKMLKRINKLINECTGSAFEGIGKPEPLIGSYSGLWSRRIDDEHRLVYALKEAQLFIFQCRFHYDK